MADDLDLRTIRAFVAVVDAGDFTAAARTLGLSRSAVGKSLARLERNLGVGLLHRTTRRVSVTADGAIFHEHCAQLLADLAEAERAVRQERQNPRGILKLTAPDAYGKQRILPILQRYMRHWPEVGIEVSFTDRIVDIVEEGLDLAIRMGLTQAGNGLVTRTVDQVSGVLCASPDYLRARGRLNGGRLDGGRLDGERLDGHDLLLFGERGRIRPWPVPSGAKRPSPSGARAILDSAEAQRLLALAGLGIAHLPDFLIAADLATGALISLPSRTVEHIDVHVLYPDRRLLPARARLFIDMLVEGLG